MVNKAQLDAQNAIIEELKGLIVKLQEKVADLEKKQMIHEQSKKSNISEEKTWAKVLFSESKKSEYVTNVLNVVGIEQKARKKKERSVMVFGLPASTASLTELKQKEDAEKDASIQVTVKMDRNVGPMFLAEITKAARCLKDNPNYKPRFIENY